MEATSAETNGGVEHMPYLAAEINKVVFEDLTTVFNAISRIEAYNQLMAGAAESGLQDLNVANCMQGQYRDLVMTCVQNMLRTKHGVHGFLRSIRDAVEPAHQFLEGRVRDKMTALVPVGAYLPHLSAFGLHSTPNEVIKHAITHPRNFNTRHIYEQARGLPWSALIETVRCCTTLAHKLLVECEAFITFSRLQDGGNIGCPKNYVLTQMIMLNELAVDFSRSMGRCAGYLQVCIWGWGGKFREMFNSHLYLEAVDDLTDFTAMQE
jgi:hypothetical protein